MQNKIEILRALCFSKEDFEKIQNIDENEFEEIEIEFMIEFKKIYQLGLIQLQKFIDKMDSDGDKLAPWDVEYYVKLLLNGPLGSYVVKMSEDKKYFTIIPDILGQLGNSQITKNNVTSYEDGIYQMEVSVDLFNKSPKFVQSIILKSVNETERIFRSSLTASVINDNTLPLADKNPQLRYQEEGLGKWVLRSHGSLNVKDSYYRLALDDIRVALFEQIKETISETYFRFFEYKKTYNPFSEERNLSKSKNFLIKKLVEEDDRKMIENLDINGDVIDSRIGSINIDKEDSNKEYFLHTIDGQLKN